MQHHQYKITAMKNGYTDWLQRQRNIP